MRPTYVIAAAAALALSASAAWAGPFQPDTSAAAGTSVIQVHNSCHTDVRGHGGYDHYHQWQGGSCRTYAVQGGGGGGGHCHNDVRYHSHSGYGALHHSHQGYNCAISPRYQNYPRNDNCVTLGSPAFSFQLCD
jgi:hypothetical protein